MTSPVSRLALAASIAAALWLVSASSWADPTKGECVDADTSAQDLRRDGKLSLAREQLYRCASPACPAMVREDCTKRLEELEAAQPTIAFEVKDAQGSDVSAVTVQVDGRVLTRELDGTPLSVDRGSHVFTFTAAGEAEVTRTFVMTEGQKGRLERITLTGSLPAAEGARAPAGSGLGAQRITALIAGGAGVVSVAVASAFGAGAFTEWSHQQTDCMSAGVCMNHAQALADHSSGTTDAAASTALFIAGGALLASGAALFFTAHPAEKRATTGLVLAPSVGPGSCGIALGGAF